MPADLTCLDIVALVTFLVVWIGYSTLFDGYFRRPSSINSQMVRLREVWMGGFLSRGLRMMDSMLIGHSIHSATFFASTTIILLAALFGVLGSAERIHSATMSLTMRFGGSTQAMLELKVLLLIGIFVYAFFKFTWAIRQFNYFCAIIGAAPELGTAPPDPGAAKRMAIILSHAVWQFNAGIRAHYFALAALGWFIHPLAFLAMSLLVPILLVRRQLFSPTQRAIIEHTKSLAVPAQSPPPPAPGPAGIGR